MPMLPKVLIVGLPLYRKSNIVENVTDPLFYAPFAAGAHTFALQSEADRIMSASVVQNCSPWDSLGVGFASVIQHANTEDTPKSLADSVVVTGRPFEEHSGHPITDGSGLVARASFQQGIKQLLTGAAMLLDQQVTRELSVTDGTKTTVGALWDMSVVVLGIVAMACGRRDTEGWIANWLDKALGRLSPQSAHSATLDVSKSKACHVVVAMA